MANLTIKDLPDALYADLKRSAAENRRSIAAQTTVILERALGHRAASEEDSFIRVQKIRERMPVYVRRKDLRSAIDEGRT
ncbi:MAG: hypothetical protein COV99_06595 [Bacteroidetes bacterium CG12_big_fil_rev_8_21_14_0_65_60_17]|nr:MAG: hypothetical protein COV99_06595 [Bacteroidetes bacterium CG12_big_fil_rev_8_21_14_0_65_60_17]